jgi:hypothetical protein
MCAPGRKGCDRPVGFFDYPGACAFTEDLPPVDPIAPESYLLRRLGRWFRNFTSVDPLCLFSSAGRQKKIQKCRNAKRCKDRHYNGVDQADEEVAASRISFRFRETDVRCRFQSKMMIKLEKYVWKPIGKSLQAFYQAETLVSSACK